MTQQDKRTALPQLLDCAKVSRELGISRGGRGDMRQVPKVHFDGLRKVYVRREDVRRLLDEGTRAA